MLNIETALEAKKMKDKMKDSSVQHEGNDGIGTSSDDSVGTS